MADECEIVEEQELGGTIIILIILLMISMILGYLLKKANFIYLHEAGVATIIGILFSGFLYLIGEDDYFAPVINLNVDFFLLFLLPPIIFEAGYNMDKKPFFKNFGGIMMYAFLGTFISAVVVSCIIYGVGMISGVTQLSFAESCAFGALISATDPVSVLAIMKDMNADSTLYSLIFGESIFNDAVTIVLYRTILKVTDSSDTTAQILISCGMFFVIFIGSFLIGVGVALFASFILKKVDFVRQSSRLKLEAMTVLICPWFSFLLSESLEMSGIVSILFCGIFMARYAYPNLHDLAKEVVREAYEIFAHASETLIFIFLGMGMWSFDLPYGEMGWQLLLFMLIAVLVGRAVNIVSCTAFLNMFRVNKISTGYQFFMWFSGLRGAIAFALAIDSVQHFDGGDIILTLTLVYAVLTIILVGGGIAPLLVAVTDEKSELTDKFTVTEPDTPFQIHSHNCFKKLKNKMKEWDRNYLYHFFVREEPETPIRTPEFCENTDQQPVGISMGSVELSESQADTPPELNLKDEQSPDDKDIIFQ